MIKVRATKDGQKLYIKEISGERNHELSEVMRYFSEGIEGKSMGWRQESFCLRGNRYYYSTLAIQYIMLLTLCLLHYIMF